MSTQKKIMINPDEEVANEVRKQLKKNGGYCPCVIEKTEDSKCMCKEFRENTDMLECHCGLYIRV